jgi:ubiquinone/menaquinone biosynthesis C-methylase UbiE
MQSEQKVVNCYDSVAARYADKFFHELENKHMDRVLLQSFASENAGKGRMIDLGCGPGQTTAFLSRFGVIDILGMDISPIMIEQARKLNPRLKFETGNMLQLNYSDDEFGSAVAFYAIVHFDEKQLTIALNEIKRVIKSNSQFLFSFHVGNEVMHHDTFLDHPVNIDFYFWETNKIIEIAKESGFQVVDIPERRPYPNIEYPSLRAYVWLEKP